MKVKCILATFLRSVERAEKNEENAKLLSFLLSSSSNFAPVLQQRTNKRIFPPL